MTKDAPKYMFDQKPTRSLYLNTPDGGPKLCRQCGVYGLVDVRLHSTYKGESDSKPIGEKCMWCDWQERHPK